ncbi:MAG: ATP--guanido phosphotransferase [Cytophagales bacterium]|nr:ATP--guanido phosphotransferase [Armatimonadota bacterium]
MPESTKAASPSSRRSLAGYLKTASWVPQDSSIGEEWPDGDVVLSARARLARNLEAYPFPNRANERDLRRAAQEVRQAAHADSERLAHLHVIAISPLAAKDRAALVDARRISPELADGGAERYALLDDPGALTVFINEEDHVRIQSLASGSGLTAALRLAEDTEQRLSRRLRWARDETFWGYQTASLANVGTGLRLSLLVHLPALAFLGRLEETLRVIHTLDISVRGAHGERSEAAGDLYQVSNAVTFGRSAGEIVGRVKPVGDHLVRAEREARQEIASGQADRLRDAARAAWSRVEAADRLTAKSALDLLSALRLAAAVGLAPSRTGVPAPDARRFASLISELRTGAGLASPPVPSGAPSAVRDAIGRPAKIRLALRAFYG